MVAVRRVVPVEAPDAVQGGNARDPRRPELAGDGAVQGLAIVAGGLGGV